MMTRDEFTRSIAVLTAGVGKPMPLEQLEAWFAVLGDMTVEQLQAGIVTTLRTHEFAGFPPVGLIRKNAVGKESPTPTLTDRSTVAWIAVKRAVSLHGGYQTVQFDDPIITATIRALGGWERICTTDSGEKFDTWLRKEFETTYSALIKCGVNASDTVPLPGLCDVANSATGHADRTKVALIETGLSKVPERLIRGEVPKRIESPQVRKLTAEVVKSLELPPEEPAPPKMTAEEKEEARQDQKRRLLEKYPEIANRLQNLN